jgi:hypothetical protein
LRSAKENEFELGHVKERMVKGLRNELNTVLWKMESSSDMSSEVLRNMIKTGMESMEGVVKKVMNGGIDGIAKDRKEGSGRKCRKRKEQGKWKRG